MKSESHYKQLDHLCMIDAEFSLKTVRFYVGHRWPQSIETYTKVALTALREVAMGNRSTNHPD